MTTYEIIHSGKLFTVKASSEKRAIRVLLLETNKDRKDWVVPTAVNLGSSYTFIVKEVE